MQSIHAGNYRQGLKDYIFEDSVASVFLVGAVFDQLLSSAQVDAKIERLKSLRDAEGVVASLRHGESATLVLDTSVLGQTVEESLGRALRSFPHRVLLHCVTASDDVLLSDNVFFAFGFRKVLHVPPSALPSDSPAEMQGQEIRWFEYRLSSYKPAPDWLNARFWANPERYALQEDPDLYSDEEE